jgi:hypothetical protein
MRGKKTENDLPLSPTCNMYACLKYRIKREKNRQYSSSVRLRARGFSKAALIVSLKKNYKRKKNEKRGKKTGNDLLL